MWFIVFGVLILLFAAFIFFGIKAGEYAQKAKTGEVCAEYNTVYTEVNI